MAKMNWNSRVGISGSVPESRHIENVMAAARAAADRLKKAQKADEEWKMGVMYGRDEEDSRNAEAGYSKPERIYTGIEPQNFPHGGNMEQEQEAEGPEVEVEFSEEQEDELPESEDMLDEQDFESMDDQDFDSFMQNIGSMREPAQSFPMGGQETSPMGIGGPTIPGMLMGGQFYGGDTAAVRSSGNSTPVGQALDNREPVGPVMLPEHNPQMQQEMLMSSPYMGQEQNPLAAMGGSPEQMMREQLMQQLMARGNQPMRG
jgi:hypothetical protein